MTTWIKVVVLLPVVYGGIALLAVWISTRKSQS